MYPPLHVLHIVTVTRTDKWADRVFFYFFNTLSYLSLMVISYYNNLIHGKFLNDKCMQQFVLLSASHTRLAATSYRIRMILI